MRRWHLCAFASVALIGAWMHARADTRSDHIAVVVSARWKTPEEIPLSLLRRVYLGRVTQWAGRSIERYELPTGDQSRVAFSSVVFGRSERELEDYWLEQALTGGAIPPREASGIEAMKDAIAGKSGTIGYIPLADLSSTDRAELRILGLRLRNETLLPGEERYPIRLGAVTSNVEE